MAFGRKASLCFQVLYLENIAQWKHRLRDKRETTASVCTHIVSSFTKFFKMPNEFTDNFLELKQVKHSQISYFLYAKWRFLSLKYFFVVEILFWSDKFDFKYYNMQSII